VLTPLPETAPDALAKADALWRACGANVTSMSAETHDAIFAAVSHLPHVLAFALVAEIAHRPNAAQLFGFCAGGFRDFTRIAGSSPEMWRDISLHNRDALLQEMQAYQSRLSEIVQALERNDGAALEALFTCAREARNRWLVKN
jgi:prephenate dehydrogenase